MIKTSIEPLGFRVLVKLDDIERVTPGGIILAQDEKLVQWAQQRATVVAIGPIAWQAFRYVDDSGIEKNGRPWVKIGDKVLVNKYAGQKVVDTDSGEEFALFNDEDIICKDNSKRDNEED
jgi:co-chaperonin GroES (HSP10)